MLRIESVNVETLDLIRKLFKKEYLSEFILVGGTGLALQIGHRKSDDIDLFCLEGFDNLQVLERLESDFGFELDYSEKNTLKGSIKNIKVDLMTHNYRYVKDPFCFEGISIASKEDICAMKLNAICNDGSRVKDFIDIYYLLNYFSVGQMLDFYKIKYNQRNAFHALKSITFFSEVNINDWPVLISEKKLTWKKIKKEIQSNCQNYLSSLKN